MPPLSISQYEIVYNALSFTIAGMGASFVFFLLMRNTVAYRYQRVMVIAALIVGIASSHYVRMFSSWSAAYISTGGTYTPTGVMFNEAYRYADWLLTVPLLLVELIAILSISGRQRGSLTGRLVVASALMIVLGYPGEVAVDIGTRLLWGTLSTIPFIYILYVLWVEVGLAMTKETPEVRVLMRNLRLVLLASWGVYPIAFLLPLLNLDPAVALVSRQVGYSIADLVAKPIYGLLIYTILRIKTSQEPVAIPNAAVAVVQ